LDPLSLNNLAVSVELSGRLADAVALYAQAANLAPEWPEPHANLGNVLRKLGRLDDAVPPLRQALALDPNHAKAHNYLGIVLQQLGRLDEAIVHYRRAIELRPNHYEAWNNLGIALNRLGDIREAIAAHRRSLECKPDARSHSALLFTLHYDPDLSPQAIFEEHLAWAREHEAPLLASQRPHEIDRTPGRRLRIGYVSADFREHTRALFVEPVLEHHDHERFEIFCYSDVVMPDTITQRIRSHADVWRQTAGMPDEQLAELIRRDRIDILIDLTGHMAGNRLPVFARKPAPIQMTWPGYPNTSGLSSIDYCIGDELRDPFGKEKWFSEKLIRLDISSQCYRPSEDSPTLGPPPCIAKGHITFASLNKPIKHNAFVIEAWSRILHAVKDSRLMLLANPSADQPMLDRFAAHGVDAKRIELIPRQSRRDYLDLHNRIDINLDPWPYNGHTTLLDGLWMGVPAVVLEGQSHVSREGSAVMRLLGLSELIANSFDQYVLTATGLSMNRACLGSLRNSLRSRFENSPLMNHMALTRRLESSFVALVGKRT
jgi:predicted O-linked N-acetylglucosamine transferase (SPINDLY family)